MFDWIVAYPKAVLWTGAAGLAQFLSISLGTGNWGWFPRGGALMALAGFMVSVREALLYRPAREERVRSTVMAPTWSGVIRFNRFGPIPNPDSINDPDMTPEALARLQMRWDDAEPYQEQEVVESADPGHPMRDIGEMDPAELRLLRIAAFFDVAGTLVWAFGDLDKVFGL